MNSDKQPKKSTEPKKSDQSVPLRKKTRTSLELPPVQVKSSKTRRSNTLDVPEPSAKASKIRVEADLDARPSQRISTKLSKSKSLQNEILPRTSKRLSDKQAFQERRRYSSQTSGELEDIEDIEDIEDEGLALILPAQEDSQDLNKGVVPEEDQYSLPSSIASNEAAPKVETIFITYAGPLHPEVPFMQPYPSRPISSDVFDIQELADKVSENPRAVFFLEHAFPKDSVHFSHYYFRLIPQKIAAKRDCFTITSVGFITTVNGKHTITTFEHILEEYKQFVSLRKLRMSQQFLVYKLFKKWRHNVSFKNFLMNRENLKHDMLLLQRNLREAVLSVQKIKISLSCTTLLDASNIQNISLETFLQNQAKYSGLVEQKLHEARSLIRDVMINAAHGHLLQYGFVHDDSNLLVDPTLFGTPAMLRLKTTPDGKYLMTFSLKQEKKRECQRITRFVNLVDYIVITMLHTMMTNSVAHLHGLMHLGVHFTPPPEMLKGTDVAQMIPQPDREQTQAPLFFLDLTVRNKSLRLSPDQKEWLASIDGLLSSWFNVVVGFKQYLNDICFDMFISPLLGGVKEDRMAGDGPRAAQVIRGDKKLTALEDSIIDLMQENIQAVLTYSDRFKPVCAFHVENMEADQESIVSETVLEIIKQHLTKYTEELTLLDQIIESQTLGLFILQFERFKEQITPLVERYLRLLFIAIPRLAKEKVEGFTTEVDEAQKYLETEPISTLNYVEFLDFVDKVVIRADELDVWLEYLKDLYDIAEEFVIPVPPDDHDTYYALSDKVAYLHNTVDLIMNQRDSTLEKFNESISKDIRRLMDETFQIRQEVQEPWLIDINSDSEDVEQALNELAKRLSACLEKGTTYKNYQKSCKVEVSRFEVLDDVLGEVKLRQLLWDSLVDWDETREGWLRRDFNTINPDSMNQTLATFQRNINQFEKGLPPNHIVPILKEKVQEMRDRLPVITNLRNPNLKPRHWMKLEQILNFRFSPEDTLNLKILEDIGIYQFATEITEISGQASSEAGLEYLLKKIEDTWKTLEFMVIQHKDSKDVFIMGSLEEVQAGLDDTNINLATISSSRHVGPIKPRVDAWESSIALFSTTLEEWSNCQTNWLYLEPIFTAPDIQRQLPNEAKKFAVVDKSFKEIMRKTAKNPLAMPACTAKGMLANMQNNNILLEQILKCLEAYLESKRVVFPRFYFLSNEELLEILAQTRNPHAVQPHLRKCFDAIAKLEFGTKVVREEKTEEGGGEVRKSVVEEVVQTTDIIAMISPENEKVELGKGLKARGNVEDWLGKVEDSMFHSLWRLMKIAITDYEEVSRTKWVLRHASQIVTTVGLMMWAGDVERALIQNQIEKQERKCFSDLTSLAIMVRSDLNKLKRSIITSLITLDVHARDIVSTLVEMKINNTNDFEWVKQLRYYWELEVDTCIARMSSARYEYGFEYLGASPRLVVTPLTDKCYLCLMGALQLDLGGAPAGPAGTGKTETTKDLAKALAIQCVVFNCSEGLDYKMMGRFFSGLAQSGAWCCFDEFNRIDIEVLSVIAQQLITIRNAKLAKVSRFMFEGREIKLIPRCAAFITMNPGYAGRTELPDNLKSAFRPMAMMVPDYGLIAEVILYSEGFESSKKLSQKMVNMYKLCSEQLSQQDHYDFGMRAVKSVLVMAGSLKRENPDISEDVVLIRALRDSNLPKFLADDVELFQGVISDLFPGVEIPSHDYGMLRVAMEEVLLETGLQVHPTTLLKIIQLYETMIVRHGVMTVGPTGGGKTTVLHALKGTLIKLYENQIPGNYYRRVNIYTLNPKSITMGELYGEVNLASMEWKDGLLGIFVRKAVKTEEEIHQWVVCDGPVDAVWIESMNTVLDDNKLLCLTNSERIKLTPWIHMVFEVEDLSQASPATVSRCGMVYIDPEDLKFMPYVHSWLERFLPTVPLQETLVNYINNLFNAHMESGFNYIKKNQCQVAIPQVAISKASTVCSLFQSLIKEQKFTGPVIDVATIKTFIVQSFVFSYIWGVGGNLTDQYREGFESHIRVMFEEVGEARLPPQDLWEVYMNTPSKKLEPLSKAVPVFKYKPDQPFFDILVPTIDTERFGLLMELLLNENHPVMLTGSTGVGKSVIAKGVLLKMSEGPVWVQVSMNFSAQTSSSRTQEMLEAKMDKRKKTLLGAPLGKKMAIFVDDVNMPRPEKYGAMPPIELLRQMLDFHGFYDRDKMFWKKVVDIVLCSACGPPGGGRNALTARFVRHFALFFLPFPSDNALKSIFRAIVVGFFTEFAKPIQDVADNIVFAAVELYQRISEDLLPTPAKSHYVFNLRDLSKCVQGVLQADSGTMRDLPDMLRLFFHECLRVFHDRLICQEDKSYFYQLMCKLCDKYFGTSVLTLPSRTDLQDYPVLLFGDFMTTAPKEERIYEEIRNIDKLKSVLSDYLMDYNLGGGKNMKLIFFMDAIEHVCRLARMLRSERGNGLLVGVGGMGKQSLTRLGAHLNEAKTFQIELTRNYDYNSFHEDLRKIYFNAGGLNEDTVFIFTDTQIVVEEFLEDINNVLNSGEVPNLFEADEYEKVIIACRPGAKEVGILENNRDAIYDFFISRVRSRLHLVLCMSPVGDAFRRRCRMFPSLVNCCTIDWFTEWPEEALVSVAQSSLKDVVPANIVNEMARMCFTIHSSVEQMTHRFYNEMRRYYYVTPSSYLDLLKQFESTLENKKKQITYLRDRISNGLKKLYETNDLVAKMKITLQEMGPKLIEKTEATKILMVSLVKEKSAADEVRTVVVADEAVAKQIAEEMQIMADDAQKDLDLAMPAMEAATKALEALNKNDINEIRVFIKPPPLVKFVMEAVCLLLGAKQDWSAAKVVLGDTNFLKKLQEYDKDNIADAMLKKLKNYVDDPSFQPDLVAAQSRAAKSLCLWVRAIDKYSKVFKVVEPKKKKVEAAEKELNKIMSVLRAKQRKLAEVEGMIAKLEARYDASVAEKQSLEDTAELCSARLGRAARLTAALADEQARWQISIQVFAQELHDIVGNVLIAAACVAYLGVFTSNYREELSQLWLDEAKKLKIPASPIFSLLEILADPYEVRVWNTCGLPKDKVSTENAIYVTKASRWPLMIDPQEQANRWIRQMEAENELIIVKLTDGGFMRKMETAVRMGTPVLIWEVGETLDPTLAPILAKAIFVQGGRELIRLGDSDVEYDRNFRLYITTKLSNPHYLPEICIQVTLVNFTVTPSGLEDQLLADVVSLERPELEKQRTELIVRINKDKNQLKDIEDKILKLLFSSEGNILDDEELIETLNISKETSAVIGSRIAEAEETEQKITIAREGYRTVATRGSVLYFVVAALADIDPMYQFSLKYFSMIFNSVIETSTKSTDINVRLKILIDAITLTIYNNVSRGLFEKHKLVFSLLLCCSVYKQAGEILEDQWSFIIRGPVGSTAGIPKKPNIPGLTELNWMACNYLAETYPIFKKLPDNVGNRMVITVNDYVLPIELLGPDKPKCEIDWDSVLNLFERMMIIKALKEEKLVFAFTEYVKVKLGKSFIESPLVSLASLYADTSNITPLIFVLSTGSDPVGGFMRFALETGNMDKVASTSLGQGQGPIAQKIIEQGVIRGDWVFLQNCHLASSWMLSMERIVMNISENPAKTHPDFRLFLSSMPSKNFPVSVLQNSVKVTNEPPKGIRANLKRAFAEIQENFFETHVLNKKWRTMIFGLCFFHAVIQERKKFGPLGWNILYEFNDSDRECALLNLNLFIAAGSLEIPWDALEYITGEITYGGRVTDYWDQRTLKTILKGFFSPPTLEKNYKYSASGTYFCPESSKCRKLEDYRNFIDQLPLIEEPEIFGMHENANIAFQIKETSGILMIIIEIQPKQSATGEGKSSDEIVYELAEQYEERIMKRISSEEIYYQHLKRDSKGRVPSLTTVLLQEADRFNKMLRVIHTSLRDLKRAIKGFVVMSDALEGVYKAFMNNMIPQMWQGVAYPSVKSLGSWTKDLELRLDFVQVWVNFGSPTSFWLSGLFFPQGFMTGVLQTYARKYDFPIDQLKIDFTVSTEFIDQEDVEKDHKEFRKDGPNTYKTLKPLDDGVWVHGLFLDAARYDIIHNRLTDSKPGEMVAPLPALGLIPVGQAPSKEGRYEAPLYKTGVRAGTLSTTGHSTNFVIAVLLPTDLKPDYWILKGTALLTQMSD